MTGEILEITQATFNEQQRLGQYNETDRPSESRILWARASATSDDVVGVLQCQRHYYVSFSSDGAVIDDANPVLLDLWRVERDDGQWRISGVSPVDIGPLETSGGDQCATYDGTEVTDDFFAEKID